MSMLASLTSWLSSPGPTAAIEIAADRVTAVLAGSGRPFEVTGHATEALPAGAVQAAVTGTNVQDRPVVTAAIRAVVDRLPTRPVRIGVVVPDSAAKVSLVAFDSPPRREADLGPMVQWQVRKAVPFRLEEAQVAYAPGVRLGDGGREYLVVVMRRDIVEEYEGVCRDAGLQPGVVDLATLSLINAGLTGRHEDAGADWLLVHGAAGYQSVGIVRGEHLVLFRNHVGEDGVSDLVHQTAMYYEDRLGGTGITRVLVARHGGSPGVEEAARVLATRVGAVLEPVRPKVAFRGDDSALPPLAAPIGLLAREHAAAA